MTIEEGNIEQRIQDDYFNEFQSKLGAYCPECGTAKQFYLTGIQKNFNGKDTAFYNCFSCRHTFNYNDLIN